METRARQRCAELPDDGLPRRLALWCWADQRPRLSLYERHGYTERWAQQHMRRNLRRPRPAVPFPNGIKIVPWELEHDELMRQAYDSAFRDQRHAVLAARAGSGPGGSHGRDEPPGVARHD